MNDGPLVSVVIPCHGYGRYLGEAIESALGQTYRDVEVIVVDDGSLDETPEVAARYPVRYVRQDRSGVCVASNRGFATAKGELMMRLDADDVLAPTYVEETAAALAAHSDAHYAYTDFPQFGVRSGAIAARPFSAEALAERNYVHASALMRRASFERAGGYRDHMSRSHCADWDLWLSFADLGMAGILVPKPLLHYRQHRIGLAPNDPRPSLRWLRRAYRITSHLQDHHPRTFAAALLLRRLATLPWRLVTREVSVRHGLVVTCFYGVMLMRTALGLRRPHDVTPQ
ncbi:MAG: glycosyltransferase [Elusimicrobia bacterium]|nr:glycosyltransferase [Elusimicrobiota bacterium]